MWTGRGRESRATPTFWPECVEGQRHHQLRWGSRFREKWGAVHEDAGDTLKWRHPHTLEQLGTQIRRSRTWWSGGMNLGRRHMGGGLH